MSADSNDSSQSGISSEGFKTFDGGKRLVVNLDGVNNLITGRIRTGVTGRRVERPNGDAA